MICDENTNESCLSATCAIHLHSLYGTSFCKEFLGAHIFLKAKLRVCTAQGDQNIWGYSTSIINPTAFITDALSIIIWTTCWCPTSPMTFRNKLEMKCLSLHSLVPVIDLIKKWPFLWCSHKIDKWPFLNICPPITYNA